METHTIFQLKCEYFVLFNVSLISPFIFRLSFSCSLKLSFFVFVFTVRFGHYISRNIAKKKIQLKLKSQPIRKMKNHLTCIVLLIGILLTFVGYIAATAADVEPETLNDTSSVGGDPGKALYLTKYIESGNIRKVRS